MTLRVLSLFSGIGGLDLGLERAGMRVVQQVEIDPFCQRALAKHWPEVPRHGDIKAFHPGAGSADVVAGGFPCQPHSTAGRRRGRDDARNLWPEFARVVDAVRPRWILGENVPGIRATLADELLGDLEALGYACWPLVVAAEDCGAPHRRARVWFVGLDMAYADRITGGQGRQDNRGRTDRGHAEQGTGLGSGGGSERVEDVADADSQHAQRRRAARGVAGAPGTAEGEGHERKRRGNAVGRGGEAVAVAGEPRLAGRRRLAQRAGPQEPVPAGSRGAGEELADAARAMRAGGSADRPERKRTRRGRAEELADADGERHGERGLPAVGRQDIPDLAGCPGGQWPARPGQQQWWWEEPQLISVHGLVEQEVARQHAAGAESALGTAVDGLPRRLARWRRSSIKAVGNSVVPQVVELVGRAIVAADAALREPAPGGAA